MTWISQPHRVPLGWDGDGLFEVQDEDAFGVDVGVGEDDGHGVVDAEAARETGGIPAGGGLAEM